MREKRKGLQRGKGKSTIIVRDSDIALLMIYKTSGQKFYKAIKDLNDTINCVGFPYWLSGKEHACQCRRLELDSWVRKIP